MIELTQALIHQSDTNRRIHQSCKQECHAKHSDFGRHGVCKSIQQGCRPTGAAACNTVASLTPQYIISYSSLQIRINRALQPRIH